MCPTYSVDIIPLWSLCLDGVVDRMYDIISCLDDVVDRIYDIISLYLPLDHSVSFILFVIRKCNFLHMDATFHWLLSGRLPSPHDDTNRCNCQNHKVLCFCHQIACV